MSRTLRMLNPMSDAYALAWQEVARAYGDVACECPVTGERWQYMGSIAAGDAYSHEFRHRSLDGKRVYFSCESQPAECEFLVKQTWGY